jgi:rare lipoprotein A
MIGNPYRINGVWYYPAEDKAYDRIGFASWYGPGFHGNRTASGERYDRRRFTAAHTTLPMPVVVRVTNLKNGRSTLVRVNDRGPFIPGRIIDVSEAAAHALGFKQDGLARVRVQYVSRADGRPVAMAPAREPPPAGIPIANAAEATGALPIPADTAGVGASETRSESAEAEPPHRGTPSHTHARFLVEMR